MVLYLGGKDVPWVGSWCSVFGQDPETEKLVHFYARHLYDGREFRIQAIEKERVWDAGSSYSDLPTEYMDPLRITKKT